MNQLTYVFSLNFLGILCLALLALMNNCKSMERLRWG